MKVLFCLGSRSEWGYIEPVYRELISRGHSPKIWACNMASSYKFGNLAATLESQGYDLAGQYQTAYDGGTPEAAIKSMAEVMGSAASYLSNNRPDWVVLSGDRPEQFAFLLAAAFAYIPTAHIQAGERSGNIDGATRHAMARYAHLHFAANQDAERRLLRTGEEPWRVLMTGAPQLDLLQENLIATRELLSGGIISSEVFALGIFHANTDEQRADLAQVREITSALKEKKIESVWIAPNNDPGSQEIYDLIRNEVGGKQPIHTNLPRNIFASLLRSCQFIIGNSSSGILEAATFGTPAVNVGERQRDRFRGTNVIDVEPEKKQIIAAIELAQSQEFSQGLTREPNPYGDGKSASRIVDALQELGHEKVSLMKKRVTF